MNTAATVELMDTVATDDLPAASEEPVIDTPSAEPQWTRRPIPLPAVRNHHVRERQPPTKLNLLSLYHMTAKRALKEDPATAKPAIEAELRTL